MSVKPEKIEDYLAEAYPDDNIILLTGFEDAFLGVGEQFSRATAVYDYDKCIKCLVADGMSEEEAVEYFSYNVQGAWLGDSTPTILYRPRDYGLETGKRVVYISGPMTGIKEFNFPAFDAARDELVRDGWEVLSPADMDRAMGIDGAGKTGNERIDHETFLRLVDQDIACVKRADMIYMLRGWEKSKGANAEHALGRWLGKKIIYQDSD